MLKFLRYSAGALALTIAVPALAQPASPTTSNTPAVTVPASPHMASPTQAGAAKTDLVDINSASAAELRTLQGVGEADATKIVQGRPYKDKAELVSRKLVPETTYDKIKDHIAVKPAKS
jgi:DNA uptake protein ComE-like DNA-binding protein